MRTQQKSRDKIYLDLFETTIHRAFEGVLMSELRIAVCDDEAMERRRLSRLIEKTMNEDAAFSADTCILSEYESGASFLASFRKGAFDLIFMDIMMPEMDGLTTTAKLRAIDDSVPVSFTTTNTEHALEAYESHVIRYLIKPVRQADVADVLHLSFKHKNDRPGITLRVEGVAKTVAYDSILFLEQHGHQVLLNLDDGSQEITSARLVDIMLQLPNQFYQCHKSFAVNLDHCKEVDRELNAFLLEDGSYVNIRRESRAEAARLLTDHLSARSL